MIKDILAKFDTLPESLKEKIVATIEHAMREDDAHNLTGALEEFENA